MKKKILIATDFSKTSLNAIMYALELYKTDRCDFYVLNVFKTTYNLIEDIIPPKPGEKGYDIPYQKSTDGLERISKLILFKEDDNPYHNFEYISLNKPLLKGVQEIVEQKDIELVIMGTKGVTDSQSSVFGSNAVEIMEKVRNCPVLVVPIDAKQELPKEIVFPTDYKIQYKRKELAHLIDIVRKCNASLKVLHATEEDTLDSNQEEHKKMLEKYFESIHHSFHTLSSISVATAVKCFVESRDSDMIAFINKKHLFFGSVFSQPLVKKIGYKLKVPVLVLHDLKN
ncbi:Nucleotide-binding universal stress UspA family protein [Tenacibaculum sp. 190130A14a]|uniref:Nucleotide-binding universal stress UspA family protein n=1 Tax=Tenacibaculum polynesiense TaxID=3137857 RepID=A0ABM9PF85_9FLAO